MRMKKAPDFRETGNWFVVDDSGHILATVYFDRQLGSWYDADNVNPKNYLDDYMGMNKDDVLDKVARTRLPLKNPSGSKAESLYHTFHQNDPKSITESARFRIPERVRLAGDALEVLYRSDKRDPETLKQPRSPIDYIHEHEEGVKVYRTDGRGDTSVPAFIYNVSELTLLGQCLGFAYYDPESDQEIEAKVTQPFPELYSIPSGKALLVIQSKRTVLALIWGGRLGVEARGIVH